MNPPDNIERSIEKLHMTTSAETDKRILDDAFAALEESTLMPAPGIGQHRRQIVVGSRIAKFAAVAAVLLVAFALFFGIPTAEGVALGEIYEALGKVRNICVSRFTANKPEPSQMVWTSHTLKVELFKSTKASEVEFVLWDISNKVKKTKDSLSGSVKTEVVSEQMLAKAEKSMTRTFGLVPFSDITDVPEGAQWNRVDDPQVLAIVPGTEVYDLTWSRTNVLVIYYRKWRVFVDTDTNLPKRAEWHSKDVDTRPGKPKGQWRLNSLSVVTYPSESEIQALIQKIFGAANNNNPSKGQLSELESTIKSKRGLGGTAKEK
jgi:hypothetical protein